MIYEIINPSDQYTCEAETEAGAVVAITLLGQGFYALRNREGESVMPPVAFLPDGGTDWFEKRFNASLEEVFNANKEAAIKCLESVLIGDFEDRDAFNVELSKIDDPVKRVAYRDGWHDAKRSSMNDIGRRAWQLAEALR